MKRGGRIKPKKRTASEKERIYGPKARVEFVKSLRCANCGLRASEHSGWIEVVNAHIENGGSGRKADYTSIIPLCTTIYATGCHDIQHRHGWSNLTKLSAQEQREAAAAATERAWQAYQLSLS